MGAPIDLTGERFGRLLVTGQAPNRKTPNGNSRRAWFCVCDCGNELTATTMDLRGGDVKSCGCLKRELDVERGWKHGDHGTHLNNVWRAMRRRCRDQGQADYVHYGGRGIRVCELWENSYAAFKEWALSNGYAEGLTIDRIDVNGDYCPENCKWATRKEQTLNRRNTLTLTCNGETKTLSEWADILGVKYITLYHRVRKGMSPEEILTI